MVRELSMIRASNMRNDSVRDVNKGLMGGVTRRHLKKTALAPMANSIYPHPAHLDQLRYS